MLCIVSGPSSVGKSTFLESPRCEEITGLPPQTPVIWPNTHARIDELRETDLLYHYNFLREIDRKLRSEQNKATTSNIVFGQDPPWKNLNNRETPKKAIVLVASKQTILQRLGIRTTIETSKAANLPTNKYPSEYWQRLLEGEDLAAIYQAWCGELESRAIPYQIVDATDSTYPILESKKQLSEIVNGVTSSYTKEQIEKALRERRFPYHRVNLPFGLHTPGADRSETRDLIFSESLEGKTILDVGCALGYFSFEAEEKGAKKVVGVELKDERFRDAMLLKEMKGSRVDFLKRDIVSNPLEENFDYILLLNVIHHLHEPFRVIRQLASVTKERLIIEFPTFTDRKFRKTTKIKFPALYNRLPLVGVSSMSEADQTFVFTPSAIKRALLDHEHLFDSVQILRSPMPGRAIVVCYKRRDP